MNVRLMTDPIDVLKLVRRLIDEALPKFDWGRSALDANAIKLLNEVPLAVDAAIAHAVKIGAWQPIETAPKDGTEVLLTDGHYKRTGYYASRIQAWSIDAVAPVGMPSHWTPLPRS